MKTKTKRQKATDEKRNNQTLKQLGLQQEDVRKVCLKDRSKH